MSYILITDAPAGTSRDTCRALPNDEKNGIYHAHAV
jgi:hypothetical protein